MASTRFIELLLCYSCKWFLFKSGKIFGLQERFIEETDGKFYKEIWEEKQDTSETRLRKDVWILGCVYARHRKHMHGWPLLESKLFITLFFEWKCYNDETDFGKADEKFHTQSDRYIRY